jgi:ferredoxin-NADP reductase
MRPSAFKRALGALAPGAGLGVDGPFGSLTLHNNRSRAAVFIAGGIGITPFMSILRQAAHERSDRPLVLLYSNRRPEDAAFLDELDALARARPTFRLLATMTEMSKSSCPRDGETRLIDAALVQRAATGLPAPIYYLAGPPAMVDGVRHTLAAAGIDDDDIRAEEFHGY